MRVLLMRLFDGWFVFVKCPPLFRLPPPERGESIGLGVAKRRQREANTADTAVGYVLAVSCVL